MNLIDAHCHVANLNQLMPVKPFLEEAKKQGINCFTRHDSLVFPINKRKEVEQIITRVFK
jgi:Tat protein secretion system quality control protein TatD with DNase activity